MPRQFNIPPFYKSPLISLVKSQRNGEDSRKRDRSPSIINLGPVVFKIARHFGFCFGVENAIEIAYRAVEENPGKRVFLLSEMIHNPHVNNDLMSRGVSFLQSTSGEELVPFSTLSPNDIVIVPAFGTSIEILEQLNERGIDPQLYNATCPFVEKVWKRSQQLGAKGYTVIIHGKASHEETRATVSHARTAAPTLVVRDIAEARLLAAFVGGTGAAEDFQRQFGGSISNDFRFPESLVRFGVVNQTTMLATETREIAELLKQAVIARYGEDNLERHFADTRDTLCYATADNQSAIHGLVESGGDIALVVGGYNSSNTSHLVEILEERVPTYYVKDAEEIISRDEIRHLDLDTMSVTNSKGWLPDHSPVVVMVSAGASCPDRLVEDVVLRVAGFFKIETTIEEAVQLAAP